MPLFSALRRQRQVDFCEFEASLVYRVSSRTSRAMQRTLSQKTKTNKKKTNRYLKNNNKSKEVFQL